MAFLSVFRAAEVTFNRATHAGNQGPNAILLHIIASAPGKSKKFANNPTRKKKIMNRAETFPGTFAAFAEIATRRDAPLPLRATSGAASVLRQRATAIDERVAAIDARLSEINKRLAKMDSANSTPDPRPS